MPEKRRHLESFQIGKLDRVLSPNGTCHSWRRIIELQTCIMSLRRSLWNGNPCWWSYSGRSTLDCYKVGRYSSGVKCVDSTASERVNLPKCKAKHRLHYCRVTSRDVKNHPNLLLTKACGTWHTTKQKLSDFLRSHSQPNLISSITSQVFTCSPRNSDRLELSLL